MRRSSRSKEDFISDERLRASRSSMVETIKSKKSSDRKKREGNSDGVSEETTLSMDLNVLRGLMVSAVIAEEINTEKAREMLMSVISSWEKDVSSKTLRRKFREAMRLFAKNSSERIWSQFFGNVHPNKTVVSWEVDDTELNPGFGGIVDGRIPLYEGQEMEASTRLKPKGIMDGKTPFGGFLNNARFAVLAKKDPRLGAYMFSEALQIMREHSELSNGGIRGAHFEASMISTRNFLELIEELEGRSLALISSEVKLIVEAYIDFRRSVMTGGIGVDIMHGLRIPSEINTKEDLISFMDDVIKRVLNRNGDVFSTTPKVERVDVDSEDNEGVDDAKKKADELARYGIYASTVLLNMRGY